ncbi:MAG: hypothetical protein QF903_03825 [Planctomycetota bacterium]|nr:hypothetical protein [Planctomycetota bacterium]
MRCANQYAATVSWIAWAWLSLFTTQRTIWLWSGCSSAAMARRVVIAFSIVAASSISMSMRMRSP